MLLALVTMLKVTLSYSGPIAGSSESILFYVMLNSALQIRPPHKKYLRYNNAVTSTHNPVFYCIAKKGFTEIKNTSKTVQKPLYPQKPFQFLKKSYIVI